MPRLGAIDRGAHAAYNRGTGGLHHGSNRARREQHAVGADFGYVRKVKAGNWLAISGTTATDERGMIVGGGQMYVQARQALVNIRTALGRAGLAMNQVIRTRMFVTDMTRSAEVARAHKEVFADS